MSTTFVYPPDAADDFSRPCGSVSVTTAGLVVRLIEAAARALDAESAAARLYLERATEVLVTDTLRPDEDEAGGPRLSRWQRRRVQALIQDHLDERLSLDDLAAVARLSRSHFTRAFKATFDQTPHAYLTAQRIMAAQLAMVSDDRPLSEIALSCGFADQAHFTRAFRKAVGRPPQIWRRLSRVPGSFERGRPCAADISRGRNASALREDRRRAHRP
ncbi:MAG TPA: AraC family transcriptional regulator [Caulobacteraceae bacterium]|nr:AraC family transcriptional regulator [Caulobacteraceae bacterium]